MQKKLLIDGMSCGHCVNHLKTALMEDIKGVQVIEVNLDGKYAIVEMEDMVIKEELSSVIEELGFELKGIE
jgi:copper chaperone CopZ